MNETLVQLITGSGRGAVATILVRGHGAATLVLKYFQPVANVEQLELNRIYFGRWVWNQYEEDLVVTRTHDMTLEIHCHGGHMAAKTILDSLGEAGAKVVDSEQWVLDTQLDRFAAEARASLSKMTTKKTAGIMLDQSRHAMVTALMEISDHLRKSQLDKACDLLTDIMSYAEFGTRIKGSFQVVLIGVPNSGKSSLVNAILGFERAIVYDEPGTTRDLVSAETALQGWPITFVDTAGLRSTDDRVEAIGIQKANERLENADLILAICDLASNSGPVDLAHSQVPSIRVGTKLDLQNDAVSVVNVDVLTSAVTDTGIDYLCQLICEKLVPNPPALGQAIPISDWQIKSLQHLLKLLRSDSSQAEDFIRSLCSTAS